MQERGRSRTSTVGLGGGVASENLRFAQLIDLRKVDETLLERRAVIQKQLEALDGGNAVGGSGLKGRKVPPKYRGPSGETWAGRGARPRWLVSAIKGGKKLDDFLIGKSAPKGRRKRRSKR